MSSTSRASAEPRRLGRSRRFLPLIVTCSLSLWVAWATARRPPPRDEARVEGGSVYLAGTIHPRAYEGVSGRYHGHHAITWAGGGQSHKALIRSHVPDRSVAEALAGLGLADGGGIPAEAWESLGQATASEPDTTATGARLRVTVRWEGSGGWRPLGALLRDQGRPASLDLRFADNRQWIERYGSGCVVCLASCPGSKIANAGYTMRQNDAGAMDFRPADDLPPDGTQVEVRVQARQ